MMRITFLLHLMRIFSIHLVIDVTISSFFVHCFLTSSLFFLFLIKSFCQGGSIPELLLSLLSSWKNALSHRPAVTYVNSAQVSAVTVCVLVACLLSL